jgi:outer membrane protein OmpA-like peptidoglycan-associated protein
MTYIKLILFIVIIFIQQIPAQVLHKVIHPLMGSVSVSLSSGLTIPFTDYNEAQVGFIWKGSANYYFNTYSNQFVSIKAFGGTGYLKGKDERRVPAEFNTKILFFGTGINYGYRIGEKLFPSFSVGISYLFFNPEDLNGKRLPNNLSKIYTKENVNLNLDLELQYLISDKMTINFNSGYAANFNDWLDDIKAGQSNDNYFSFMVGVSYFFMSDVDDDNDGVGNSIDMCPDTKEGITVDQFGCPVDSDHDGVPDYLDQSPYTPSGVVVDSEGRPIDADGDGIPDYIDRCPKTPKGIEVDRSGCPIDWDYDGVPDYLDQCANTPRGVKVDKNGCPLDSDADGVPDYLDKCPGTSKGETVDSTGCPPLPQKLLLGTSTFFEPDQAVLLPSAFSGLDKVVEIIRQNPQINWRIEGHTDNTGDYDKNKLLSLRRAQAVFNYFISKNIDRNKFEIVGLGPDYPIANNTTSEGRERNRRVEIIRIN